MWLSRFLLWFFPKSFRERFGQEWLDTTQDVIERSSSNGSKARAWMGVVCDTAIQAPVSHGREVWRAIVGTPPVLATVGIGTGVWLLTRHWAVRPTLALGRGFVRYLRSLLIGGAGGVVLFYYLQQRATAGDLNPQELIIAVGFIVVGLMIVASWKSLWINLKTLDLADILGMLVAFLFGLYLSLTAIFLGQLRDVARDAIEPFILFPKVKSFPVDPIISDNPAEWTADQKQWFDTSRPYIQTLLPEKKDQWCAMKAGRLDLWRESLMAGANSTTGVAALLWQSQWVGLYQNGCIDEHTWINQHNEIAFSLRQAPGLFQNTWEPLAVFHPLIDRLMLSHYILWPRLVLNSNKYCLTQAGMLISDQHTINEKALSDICETFDKHGWYEHSGHSKWSYLSEMKAYNWSVKSITPAQRQSINTKLEQTRAQWEQPVVMPSGRASS